MCLAIPALIRSIDGYQAEGEIGGVKRVVSLQLAPQAKIGDYLLIHTGYAINVVDEEEAQETLRLLARLADEIP